MARKQKKIGDAGKKKPRAPRTAFRSRSEAERRMEAMVARLEDRIQRLREQEENGRMAQTIIRIKKKLAAGHRVLKRMVDGFERYKEGMGDVILDFEEVVNNETLSPRKRLKLIRHVLKYMKLRQAEAGDTTEEEEELNFEGYEESSDDEEPRPGPSGGPIAV